MKILATLLRFWRFEGKLSLRQEALIAGILLGAMGLCSGYELWRVQRDAFMRAAQVEHNRQIIIALNQLSHGAADVQSGARGFALLRERIILKQYYSGVNEVSSAAATLQPLLADEPEMKVQLDAIMKLYNSYLDGAAKIMMSERPPEYYTPQDSEELIAGNSLMEELRLRAQQFYESERERLQALNSRWLEDTRLDSILFSIVTVFNLAVGITGSVLFAFRIRSRVLGLTEAARSIANGDFSHSLPMDNNREFSELADTLNSMVNELDQRRRRDALSKRLWELLHASASMSDVQMTIAQICPNWIPGSIGVLYLMNHSRNLLERSGGWGELPDNESFSPGECWALRMGRTHRVNDPKADVHCDHLLGLQGPVECVPLVAHGETLGMLLLVLQGEDDSSIVTELAEVLSITIASLQMKERMKAEANSDPLTGIFNRRYMDESLMRELARARRHNLPVSLIAIDIDHFKTFNDTYGHAAGDLVLKQIARTMSISLRASDILCRQGGEEFVAILPHCRVGDAARWAEAARIAVENLTLTFEGKSLGRITISAGVASYPEHAINVEQLLAAADRALYASKEASRNCVSIAAPVPIRVENVVAPQVEPHHPVLRVMPPK